MSRASVLRLANRISCDIGTMVSWVARVAVSSTEIRQAVRRLFRSATFALVSIVTLAVGLGINAAMFGVLDALLLRPPFHIADPDRVVTVQFNGEDQVPADRTQYPVFVALRESGAFEAVAAYMNAAVSIGSGPDARIANAVLATSAFFDVLRPPPSAGTIISSKGDVARAANTAVISHAFWLRHLAGRGDAIGAELAVDRRLYTVVGIAPEGFGAVGSRPVDLWLPLQHVSTGGIGPRNWRGNTGPLWLYVVARLHEGRSPSSTHAQATAFLSNQRGIFGNDRVPPTIVTTQLCLAAEATSRLRTRSPFGCQVYQALFS